MSPKKLIRILEHRGWEFKRSRGSHHVFKHQDIPDLIVVPVHRGDIKPGLLHSLLSIANISRDELLELL